MCSSNFFYHILPHLVSFDAVQSLIRNLEPEALSRTFWICAISVNQHSIGCHRSPWPCDCGLQKVTEGPESEIGAFDEMMARLHAQNPAFYHLLALDVEVAVVTRVWVVAEIAEAHKLGLKQVMMPHFPLTLSGSEQQKRLVGIDVNKCEATVPEDKTFILGKIENKAEYNKRVKAALKQAPVDGAFLIMVFVCLPVIVSNAIVWGYAYLRMFRWSSMAPTGILLSLCLICLSLALDGLAFYFIVWEVRYGIVRQTNAITRHDETMPSVEEQISRYTVPGKGPAGSWLYLHAPRWFVRLVLLGGLICKLPMAFMIVQWLGNDVHLARTIYSGNLFSLAPSAFLLLASLSVAVRYCWTCFWTTPGLEQPELLPELLMLQIICQRCGQHRSFDEDFLHAPVRCTGCGHLQLVNIAEEREHMAAAEETQEKEEEKTPMAKRASTIRLSL